MTVKQFRRAVIIAKKAGTAKLENGRVLYFTGLYWSIRSGRETIDVADVPEKLEYLFD